MSSSARGSQIISAVERRTHRIGLVSDTHGVFHPALPAILKGVEEIFHAGDVGSAKVIDSLKRIAPVTAVSGNVDMGIPGVVFPAFARRDLFGLRVLITHYVGTPECPMPPVAEAIKVEKPGMVLSGHTHKPFVERQLDILYVNPGSCGPRRFRLPISCGVLTLHEGQGITEASVQLFDLETGGELNWQDE